jgi:hypothetical protein
LRLEELKRRGYLLFVERISGKNGDVRKMVVIPL